MANLIFSPKVTTTGIHRRYVIRQLFDNTIAGCPQQIVDNASAPSNEAIKSVTFACVEPAS
jgi:hypothetical protein